MVFELDNDLWVEVVTKISRICRLDLGRGGLLVGIGDSDGSGALTTSFCRWRWCWLGGLVIGGCGADVDGDGGHGTWSWWDVDVTPHIATSYRFDMVRDHITTPFSFLVGWQYGRGPF